VRLFLAIDPGEECRRSLLGALAGVRDAASGVRWVQDDKLHVTLAFFGEVEEKLIDQIRDATAEVVARHARFPATISGSGVFPDWRRPRVVWVGLHDGDRLIELGKNLGKMCASLGFPPDHPFRAHLTIGRVPRPLSAGDRKILQSALAGLTVTHPFDVKRVVLMRSTQSAKGSVYSEVASFPLGGA
jgi:RNA 2',3'-cyclic 3'-phosphodiesterase